jgi:hypothetical protein
VGQCSIIGSTVTNVPGSLTWRSLLNPQGARCVHLSRHTLCKKASRTWTSYSELKFHTTFSTTRRWGSNHATYLIPSRILRSLNLTRTSNIQKGRWMSSSPRWPLYCQFAPSQFYIARRDPVALGTLITTPSFAHDQVPERQGNKHLGYLTRFKFSLKISVTTILLL